MCWVIPISRNKQAFHTFGTEDGAVTGMADDSVAAADFSEPEALRAGGPVSRTIMTLMEFGEREAMRASLQTMTASLKTMTA